LDILVLLGLTAKRDDNDIIDPGDAFITYQGQRLLPSNSAVLFVSCCFQQYYV